MRAYPDPNLETKSLEIFRKMIEGTQALLEKQLGQSGPSKGPEIEQPEGRQVSSGPENLVSMEGKVAEGSQLNKNKKRRKKAKATLAEPSKMPETEREKMEEPVKGNKAVAPNSVLDEVEEDWLKSLWDDIRKAKIEKIIKRKAPLKEVDLDKKQVSLEIESRYGSHEPSSPRSSKASIMKELPSFLGDNESEKEVRRIPSQYKPKTMTLDTANLQALLSTPVKVTLPH